MIYVYAITFLIISTAWFFDKRATTILEDDIPSWILWTPILLSILLIEWTTNFILKNKDMFL